MSFLHLNFFRLLLGLKSKALNRAYRGPSQPGPGHLCPICCSLHASPQPPHFKRAEWSSHLLLSLTITPRWHVYLHSLCLIILTHPSGLSVAVTFPRNGLQDPRYGWDVPIPPPPTHTHTFHSPDASRDKVRVLGSLSQNAF